MKRLAFRSAVIGMIPASALAFATCTPTGAPSRIGEPQPSHTLAASLPEEVARAPEPALHETSAPASGAHGHPEGAAFDVSSPPGGEDCSALPGEGLGIVYEPNGPKKHFSVHGYLSRTLHMQRTYADRTLAHCLLVAWPAGAANSDGQPSSVAEFIHDGWLRAIENTLWRVPFTHMQALRRVVIDNRPKEHGIAAFNRESVDDGRDGRTIWLHEHLFRSPNHWARGNHGSYFSYHVNEHGKRFHELPGDHEYFSPVLLHELGHIVMYNVINRDGPAVATPECARTCGDVGNCQALPPREREATCISPYCMPFRFASGTENWAEQYRFFYQSSTTRALLVQAGTNCAPRLAAEDASPEFPHAAPWDQGLPDIADFRRSRWNSCNGRPCKKH